MSIRTIDSMVDWVEDHIDQTPSIADMAEYVGYSKYYCSIKFHEHIGISFKEYVVGRKLSLAAVELRRTAVCILDIALQYGFSSNEAFTRAFRKKFGYTPSQYRKEQPSVELLQRVDCKRSICFNENRKK